MLAPVREGYDVAPGRTRLQQTQAQVNEVADVVRINVDKLMERDHKLSELDHKAEQLKEGAGRFKVTADKVKRKYWWKNCKMTLILAAVIVVILTIILVMTLT